MWQSSCNQKGPRGRGWRSLPLPGPRQTFPSRERIVSMPKPMRSMHVFHNLCITCSGRTNRIIGVRSRHKSSLAKTFLKVFGAKALVIFLRFCSGPSVVGPPCSNNNWPHRLRGEGEILVDFSSSPLTKQTRHTRGRGGDSKF